MCSDSSCGCDPVIEKMYVSGERKKMNAYQSSLLDWKGTILVIPSLLSEFLGSLDYIFF